MVNKYGCIKTQGLNNVRWLYIPAAFKKMIAMFADALK